MSYDLYLFDMELPDDPTRVAELLDDESTWDQPLTTRLAAAVAELEQRFPWDEDDPDGSPWASWPLIQSVAGGRGCAFNIVWSEAERMGGVMLDVARLHDLTIYDPQSDAVVRPGDAARTGKRRWWKREPR